MDLIAKPFPRVLLLLFFSCFYIGDSNEHISLLRETSAYLCGGTPPPTVVALVKLRSFSIRGEVFFEVLLKKRVLN